MNKHCQCYNLKIEIETIVSRGLPVQCLDKHRACQPAQITHMFTTTASTLTSTDITTPIDT
ncbi:hypothetical protein E2C01_009374 [Portunus trituberculatus]|uniref:Uncharacterized protein n=1 Tax=Portunus trituberculatus TaxID=210409 RepID=A0A5B7D505_PORTR|nr:hypothetical protein [Portunus trituberculatus]